MIKELAKVFQTASIWVIVLPVLAGVINYKGLNRDSKWIFALVLAALAPQLLTAAIDKDDPVLNLSYNLYTPVEFAILYLVFFPKFRSANSRLLARLSVFLFGAFFLFLVFRFGLQSKFLNWAVCACNVAYMFWILLLIRQEYNAEETFIAKGNPFTWYLIGLALYSPGRVATLALYDYIRDKTNPLLISLSLIDSLFNILMYLFFTVGLLIRKPR